LKFYCRNDGKSFSFDARQIERFVPVLVHRTQGYGFTTAEVRPRRKPLLQIKTSPLSAASQPPAVRKRFSLGAADRSAAPSVKNGTTP
jgi:hypothetical protein